MATNTDILASRVVTVDDYLPLSGLSVERAVAALPQNLQANFSVAWNWFMDKSGTIGSRMLGERIPGVDESFAISAQRGIHVPAKTGIAVSVTVAKGSIYSGTDKPFIELPNGTWILEYSAHRNNKGDETDPRWNEGLLECLEKGYPVGVFIQTLSGKYSRYLAFVEEYHPDRGVFTLHGPVTVATAGKFASGVLELETTDEGERLNRYTAEYLEIDNRSYSRVLKAVRTGQSQFRKQLMEAYEGKCACTGCGVAETLQAAHIIGYRGSRSNVVNNGMLLRADLHLLFDSSLITVKPDTYAFELSKRLVGSDYEAYDGQLMRLPRSKALRPSEDYLAAHYEKFQQIELAS